MALFVAWFLLMGLKCNRFAPCGSRDAQLKKIVPLRLEEMPDAKTITKDVLKEKNLAAQTMKEMNDKGVCREDFDTNAIEYAIVVQDL